jgi:TolA-binding protein
MKILNTILVASMIAGLPLQAASSFKRGKLGKIQESSLLTAQEYAEASEDAFHKQKWDIAAQQSSIVLKNFPDSLYTQECRFYLGAAYFHQGNFEQSNKHLSRYLQRHISLEHFYEAIELKFQIAEGYRNGVKRHLLGIKSMPRWSSAYYEAIQIYDEVISALPNDELAAKALFGKATLQFADYDYTAAIDSFQTLIRRFPKNQLAPDSFIQIGEIYLAQSKTEYPDFNLLDLAQINMNRFKEAFPGDSRLDKASMTYAAMQEVYAQNFYEIGQFFERTKKKPAAILYYTKILQAYPKTRVAEKAQKRLKYLDLSKNSSLSKDIVKPLFSPNP